MPNRCASWLRDCTACPGDHCPALISASTIRATWRYRGTPERSSARMAESRGSGTWDGARWGPCGRGARSSGGSAVGARGARRLRRPFTCDLSGQDFTKLISNDWVPVSLALGISVGVRHDDRLTRGQTWWSAGNAEVL